MSGFWEPRLPGYHDPEANCSDWTDRALGLARWSPPRMRIIEGFGASGVDVVQDEVNALLASGVHILAISPAALALTGESAYPGYLVTVIWQERLTVPNGAPDDELSADDLAVMAEGIG
jgi:hypothetical protein